MISFKCWWWILFEWYALLWLDLFIFIMSFFSLAPMWQCSLPCWINKYWYANDVYPFGLSSPCEYSLVSHCQSLFFISRWSISISELLKQIQSKRLSKSFGQLLYLASISQTDFDRQICPIKSCGYQQRHVLLLTNHPDLSKITFYSCSSSISISSFFSFDCHWLEWISM